VYLGGIERMKKHLLYDPKDEKLQKLIKSPGSQKIPFNKNNSVTWHGNKDVYFKDKNGNIKNRPGFIIKNKPGKTQYIAPKTEPKLKNENPLLNNKIYFYSSVLVPDCICIGQTTGDVERRIKQQFKNTPDKPYKILHSDLAQKTNGE